MYNEFVMDKKKLVLVVDDEPRVLWFVKISLTTAGYDVVTAASGEEALGLMQSHKFDIILLDLLMTPMDGLEVLGRLRTFSKVPVLIFTAHAFIAADQALQMGANGFIAKPFKPEDLVKKVESMLNPPKKKD